MHNNARYCRTVSTESITFFRAVRNAAHRPGCETPLIDIFIGDKPASCTVRVCRSGHHCQRCSALADANRPPETACSNSSHAHGGQGHGCHGDGSYQASLLGRPAASVRWPAAFRRAADRCLLVLLSVDSGIADQVVLLDLGQQPLRDLHGGPGILVNDVCRYQPAGMSREAEATTIAISNDVACDAGRAATTDSDSGHLVCKYVIVHDRSFAVFADKYARVAPIVYFVALDKGRALLENGNARPPVAKYVILLDTTSAALRDEHA
mmetsp:Transcript_27363/g.69617  ORF Transcript_27363/g.69617 Transcript_27363/m.69617 type:complete len:266 (-) Transcript_27363:1052-1849(-)